MTPFKTLLCHVVPPPSPLGHWLLLIWCAVRSDTAMTVSITKLKIEGLSDGQGSQNIEIYF